MILRTLALLAVVSLSVFAADERPVVTVGPYVRFTGPDSAVVKWETDSEQIGAVEFGETTAFGMNAADAEATKEHTVTLRGLKRGAVYYNRLKFGEAAGETLTLETDFNFTKPPLPDVKPFPGEDEKAREIAELWTLHGYGSDNPKGYILDYGCGDGRLVWEMAKAMPGVSVVGVSDDAAAIAKAREQLDAAGVYAGRVKLLHCDLKKLPFNEDVFDWVVSSELMRNGKIPGPVEEAFRVTKPRSPFLMEPPHSSAAKHKKLGNDLWKKWWSAFDGRIGEHENGDGIENALLTILRGTRAHEGYSYSKLPPKGVGAWSHAYGDAGQSANSGDKTVNGRTLALKWFGEPGARGMMDRQPRNPPPLCVNGTFFIQGNDRIFALDAWNGAFLWSLEVPGLRRVNIPRDCSNMCADMHNIYVAVRDRVWFIDARSGDVRYTITVEEAATKKAEQPVSPVPGVASPKEAASRSYWGYVAYVEAPTGGQLFGSTVKPGASYTRFEGGEEFWYDAHNERSTAKVLSDSLFAWRTNGVNSGNWTHKPRGLVINPTITIGGGRMYFIESRGLGPLDSTPGRIESPALYKDTWLVALDTATGAVEWEKPAPLAPLGTAEALYLCYADEKLVLLDSARQAYHTFAYSAKDGAELWRRAQPWARDHHGGHLYHPVLVQGMAIIEPFGYDLTTGAIRLRDLPERGGCTTLSAAAECLHFINWDYDKGSLYVRDFADGQTRQFSGSRGNCWLSFISGSGMLLLPSASGGCSCRYPNQVTLGFAPEK